MAQVRFIDEHPGALDAMAWSRESMRTLTDCLTRVNPFTDAQLYVSSLRVSRGALMDGIYATQLSADQTLLFTANRGQNHVTIYDYPSPDPSPARPAAQLSEVTPSVPTSADPRLGLHHSTLMSPAVDLTDQGDP